MNTESPSCVLIVGSGPSGLILALSLVKNGIPIRIIEKRETPMLGQRGAGIQPRSLELFDQLEIVDEISRQGTPICPVRKYKMPEGIEVIQEMVLTPRREATPTNPHPNPVMLGQDHLEQTLRTILQSYGHRVEFGTELVSLQQTDAHVEVKLLKHGSNSGEQYEDAQYKWVVGADGAKGQVRKQLGLSFLGETRAENLVIGDIFVDGLDAEAWHFWGETNEMVLLRPTETDRLFSFVVGGENIDASAIGASEDSVREYIRTHVGTKVQIELSEITWMSIYRPNVRMVNTFRSGRTFVAGDAAHVHPPTGGQGMNSGVQDSINLAWKLALVIKGYSSQKLLDSYSEERIPVIAEVLNLSSQLLNQLSVREDPRAAWNRDGKVLQLGINYRWSSIVVDERQSSQQEKDGENRIDAYGSNIGSLGAGDRAPDSPGLVDLTGAPGESSGVSRLFQIFKPVHHTVLLFADLVDSSNALQELTQYSKDLVKSVVLVRSQQSRPTPVPQADFVLEDRDGHAYATYVQDNDCGIVVVRPDGMVGAILKTSDSIHRYFRGIFSA